MKKKDLLRRIKALETKLSALIELVDRNGFVEECARLTFPEHPEKGDSCILGGQLWTFDGNSWQSHQSGVLREVSQ